MNHAKIHETLRRDHNSDWITWKRNPPTGSHMCGVWERQIRTVRTILASLMSEHGRQLDDESFRTYLVEIENIVNSRPLTFPSSDPNDLEPLTPNHLLTLKSKVVMPPPGNFQRKDVYLRKRWRRVQYLLNIFWTRWKREYLNQIQRRTKWHDTKENLKENDVVLVADKSPRNQWLMGRVNEVRTDEKGLVRSAKVKTSKSILERPIDKLVLILRDSQ